MDDTLKIVEFDKWCRSCEDYATDENEDPCGTCLGIPARPNSTRPEKYREDESPKKSQKKQDS